MRRVQALPPQQLAHCAVYARRDGGVRLPDDTQLVLSREGSALRTLGGGGLLRSPRAGGLPDSSQISSGEGDLLSRVISPTVDGWWDLTPIRIEPNFHDLRSPYLCNGDKRVAGSISELCRAAGDLPLRYPNNSNIISTVVFMHDGWVQVFWDRRGICLFKGVEGRHLEVLRTILGSLSNPEERQEVGVSFSDTILSLSDYYGCQGDHNNRPCPGEGDRARSLIGPDGKVREMLLEKLRDLGMASEGY